MAVDNNPLRNSEHCGPVTERRDLCAIGAIVGVVRHRDFQVALNAIAVKVKLVTLQGQSYTRDSALLTQPCPHHVKTSCQH